MSRKPGIATLVVGLAIAGAASVRAQACPVDSVLAELASVVGDTMPPPPGEPDETGSDSQESEPENLPVVVSAGLPVGVLDPGERTPRAAFAPRMVPDRVANVVAVSPDAPKVDTRFAADAVSAGVTALLILARPVRHHAPPASA